MNTHSTLKKKLEHKYFARAIPLKYLSLLPVVESVDHILLWVETRHCNKTNSSFKHLFSNRKKIGILYHWQSNYWHSWTKEQATHFCLPVSWWNKCYKTLQCFTISEACIEVRCNECSTFCLLTMVQGDLVDQEVSEVEKRFLITSTQFIYQILYNMQTESKLINSN